MVRVKDGQKIPSSCGFPEKKSAINLGLLDIQYKYNIELGLDDIRVYTQDTEKGEELLNKLGFKIETEKL
jgi:hypothetical protein